MGNVVRPLRRGDASIHKLAESLRNEPIVFLLITDEDEKPRQAVFLFTCPTRSRDCRRFWATMDGRQCSFWTAME